MEHMDACRELQDHIYKTRITIFECVECSVVERVPLSLELPDFYHTLFCYSQMCQYGCRKE